MRNEDDRGKARGPLPRRQAAKLPETGTKRPPKVHHEARVGLNALAEWMTASETRRWRILTEQKNPRPFQTAYRRVAEDGIMKCLSSGTKAQAPLDAAHRRLKTMVPRDEWEEGQRANGLDTIESFRRCLRLPALRDLRLVSRLDKPMVVEKVIVSARPEAYVIVDGSIVGAVKLSLSKSKRLGDERAAFAGTILHAYVEQLDSTTPDPRRCFIVDVREDKVFTAPVAFKRRRQELSAALRSIFAQWPSVPILEDSRDA